VPEGTADTSYYHVEVQRATYGSASSSTFTTLGEPAKTGVDVSLTPSSYSISSPGSITGGSVTAPFYAEWGSTVTVTVTPDPGYHLKTLTSDVLSINTSADTITFTMPTTQVYISAEFEANTHAVGATGPGGGKIFYIDTLDRYPGWTYLEAAPADISGTLAWASPSYENQEMNTADGLGAGWGNTNFILVTDPASPAFSACGNFIHGGEADWYLPSPAELSEMYTRRNAIGSFIPDTIYWSSCGDGPGSAIYTRFNSGSSNEGSDLKSEVHLVRPIRRF
jgi:hypothetical protein